MTKQNTTMQCALMGIGAWGPGFNNWEELHTQLLASKSPSDAQATPPKPAIIPANERRRAPLPVKIAVETSLQASEHSNIAPEQLACVFGSGLGDTEITDYMCRALNSELKQLSPTKFHNSVHNAAAGYWTISTGCMQAANSIAAYHKTAGLALLEAASQCIFENIPVLITLFDTKAHSAYRDIFECDSSFAASCILIPMTEETDVSKAIATLDIQLSPEASQHTPLDNPQLHALFCQNPAAKILPLFEKIAKFGDDSTPCEIQMPVSDNTHLHVGITPTVPL